MPWQSRRVLQRRVQEADGDGTVLVMGWCWKWDGAGDGMALVMGCRWQWDSFGVGMPLVMQCCW